MLRFSTMLVFFGVLCILDAFTPIAYTPTRARMRQLTQVNFGNWGKPIEMDPIDDGDEEKEKPGITFQGLIELIATGAGAPNLGKFTGVDKETGTLNFELEKNNFKSKKTGKTYNSFDNRDGSYFEAGYVDDDADVMSKLGKLFGGGKKDNK
mmetsp:Transcript_58268/g.117076  ORF Transcript_58268/g.117076 Transcript_58268/m.117076 type:complete len:152 (+) Transcript_58268:52-507(+)